MEISWKILCLCIGLLLCELCNGLPINLENTAADDHTQFLTGLVAVLLTLCSVVFLAGCLCCQRRRGFKEFRDSPVVASTASNLDHGHINPVANGEFTIFTPLSPPHQNNNVFLANQQIIARTQDDYCYGDVDVTSWFNGTETDFPRIKLKYIREIGKGWFGRVVEGAAQDVNPDHKWTPVVVRILEATASSKERVVFLHDAAIYRCGTHQNILGLIGRCLDTIPLLLLQEFCPQGDLKNYLKENRVTAEKFLSTEYPLLWSCQLTSAVKHLHNNKLVHPDLATRNCQLSTNLTLKLGDYGLAVFQYPEDYYQGAPGVPIRWCAPESVSYTTTTIQSNKITMEANIWSLGVTMWEICECGSQPYSHLNDDEVISQVLGTKKVRLSRPQFQVLYTDYMFRLMQLCWTNSESRPAVSQIDLMLADLLQVYQNTQTPHIEKQSSFGVTAEDFDKRWECLKPNTIVKTDNHVIETTSIDVDDETVTKTLSPSLNNLHGSLDNLLVESESQMESWLENVATKTGDMSYVQGLSDAIKDLDNTLALEHASSSDSSPGPQNLKIKPKIEFKLGPSHAADITKIEIDTPNHNDSLTESMLFVQQRASSGSDTEEENWKNKIERGAYSEKVRQKSRSVADLMVLTHIDPSESESETPLPSLDYHNKNNYKNVRFAPKQNLENVSLMFSSEGNLLSVEDTFQDELKKLQEERRDSLLFVPENSSQNICNSVSEPSEDVVMTDDTTNYMEESPSKRLLQELNSTSEIKPANQVFNVFNVTIDKYSPIHLPTTKLEEIIHFKVHDTGYYVPKLAEIVQNNLDLRKNNSSYSNNITIINKEECNVEIPEENFNIQVSNKNMNCAEEYLIVEFTDNECDKLDQFSDSPLSEKDVFKNDKYYDNSNILTEDIIPHSNNLLVREEILNDSKNNESLIPFNSESNNKVARLENGISNANGLNQENNLLLPKSSSVKNLPISIEMQIVTENDNQEIQQRSPEIIEISSCRKVDGNFINQSLDSIAVMNSKLEGNNGLHTISEPGGIGEDLAKSSIIESEGNNSHSTYTNGIINNDNVVLSNEILAEQSPIETETENTANTLPISGSSTMTETKPCYTVPKLVDLIQDNDELMDYIIAKYETEVLNGEELPDDNSDTSTPSKLDCENDSMYHIENVIVKTRDFVNNELKNYDDYRPLLLEPKFDLSENQEQMLPNHLTHSIIFGNNSNSPLGRSLQDFSTKLSSQDAFLSLNLFCDVEKQIEEEIDSSQQQTDDIQDNNLGLYSLETWDNFLGRALDNQITDSNHTQENDLFDSFSSEPQSLLILENHLSEPTKNVEDNLKCSIITDVDMNLQLENSKKTEDGVVSNGSWDSAGGWFLHPQTNPDDVSGEMTISSKSNSDSYVGFNMDDEIMAAIRTELLNKLPHAQGNTNGPIQDDEEWDSTEQNEVFLRYNVYNTPLSPIPEESLLDDNSGDNTPKQQQSDNDDSDWSEEHDPEILHQDTESQSAQTQESPTRGHLHRHTPSQDSCCSNDTLFNLEELTCIGNDVEHNNSPPTPKTTVQKYESLPNEQSTPKVDDDSVTHNNDEGNDSRTIIDETQSTAENDNNIISQLIEIKNEVVTIPQQDKTDNSYITEFLTNERHVQVQIIEAPDESSDSQSTTENLLPFVMQNAVAAPLPSPEDKPWKQLAQSLLSNNKMLPNVDLLVPEPKDATTDKIDRLYVNVVVDKEEEEEEEEDEEQNAYENINAQQGDNLDYNIDDNATMIMSHINDIYNEADYVNIVNLENTKNSAEFSANHHKKNSNVIDDDDDLSDCRNSSPDYVDALDTKDQLIINEDGVGDDDDEHDTFGVLTDIRFNGPADSQMMTTSFSESNDLNDDEQDWDSGSDTRSSSSGEFIWKEGEHEESLKALRAAPQDLLDDIQPLEGIQEETSSSETSGSDEEGESPEFVPSAWDKYATPTKSALRSPEKTIEKAEKKKSKGVWFKKQKYHCVYEYPREPDSPVLQSYDLWKPHDYTYEDWDLEVPDTSILPFPNENTDLIERNENPYQPKTKNINFNLYQLSNIPDFISSGCDDEFYISSSAKPFDKIGDLSSQFFPGNWINITRSDNITPDSGVEDGTPVIKAFTNSFVPKTRTAAAANGLPPSLKALATEAVNKTKKTEELKCNDVLGGLRHTRSKLKLDLPPSPSAFTTNKMFNIETVLDPVIPREKPAFTTFGKSRFLVQHVETPPDEVTNHKNVSFEALPYKPLQQDSSEIFNDTIMDKNGSNRGKIEIVRGEASLLDSADEDSGIESSTLERKLSSADIKD